MSDNCYVLFKLWAQGKIPKSPGMGRDHHACDAIKRFEQWLLNTQADMILEQTVVDFKTEEEAS